MVYDSSAGLLAGRAGHSSFSACVASINPGTGVATTLDSTACPVNALTDMTNNGGTSESQPKG